MKSPDEMVEFWADLKTKYPSICAIIDPFRGRVSMDTIDNKLLKWYHDKQEIKFLKMGL